MTEDELILNEILLAEIKLSEARLVSKGIIGIIYVKTYS
jgi:hypothetical protein